MEQSEKILLVEDDRMSRQVGEMTLRYFGLNVITASGGDDALKISRAELPDLIVLDMIMPGMRGLEVLRELKNSPVTASIPVVIFSNVKLEPEIQAALELGALEYWIKADFALEIFAGRVKEVLSQRPKILKAYSARAS
jgi:CheY-like chemotaxis protein